MFDKEKHPTYGMLAFSRVTSNKGQALFGSSITHRETIRMRVARGSVSRTLSNDWFFAERDILEAEMSATQFAEAITSMNMGSGVPVTLKWVNGEDTGECPFINKRKQFEQEFEQHMKVVSDKTKKVVEDAVSLLSDKSKKTLTVADKALILEQLRSLQQEISSNVPFIQQQFNEQMDKTVLEAKGEVEAFVNSKITALGIKELERLKELDSPNE